MLKARKYNTAKYGVKLQFEQANKIMIERLILYYKTKKLKRIFVCYEYQRNSGNP
jgi:hypothetical protein